jgi:four helix bundle protein
MSELAHAYSFRDLVAHRQARSVAREVFETSKERPREELFSLTDQVRRSACLVGAQIAEAWAKRLYPSHVDG